MSKIGKFIIKNFKDKKMEFFTSNENEYVHYSDTDLFSWTVIRGKIIDYDEESGVITLETIETGARFYLDEFKIELFWEEGLNYRDTIRSTINGSKKKNRDIM